MNVNDFLVIKGKCFPEAMLPSIQQSLNSVGSEKMAQLMALDFKDPTMMLIISFFGGGLGIDRFLIGDTGMGIGKLLTAGGCGIWALIDLFLIMDATRQNNYEKLMTFLNY